MICDLLALRPISHITKKTLSYLHSTKIEQMTKTMVILKEAPFFFAAFAAIQYYHKRPSSGSRILATLPLAVACIKAWAGRDERGILREARDEGNFYSGKLYQGVTRKFIVLEFMVIKTTIIYFWLTCSLIFSFLFNLFSPPLVSQFVLVSRFAQKASFASRRSSLWRLTSRLFRPCSRSRLKREL